MTTAPPHPAADPIHLTEALRRAGLLDCGRVTSVAVEKSFPTVLSHIFRLRLTCAGAGTTAPGSLILKAGLLDRPGGPWKPGRHEVAFYADVASAMPAGIVPRCFDAHADAESGAWHLLLEDLTDTHLVATRWPLPPTLPQCEAIVRAWARFHAAWWDDPRLGVTVGAWEDAAAADRSLQRLAAQFERFADDLGDRLSADRRAHYARLIEAAPRLGARYRARRAMTIVHGDAHVWNCFLPRDGARDDALLFDWDAWRLDIATDDLAYMMAVHWYPDLRRRIERPLLDRYHDALLAHGVQDYGRSALQDDYRLSVLWQTTLPIWQHANGIPPVIWWNNLERIHLAADDWECRGLLSG